MDQLPHVGRCAGERNRDRAWAWAESEIHRVLRDLRLGGLGRYGFDHSYLLYNVAESTVPAPLRGTGVRVGLVIVFFCDSCVSNHVLSIVLRS